MKIALTAFGNEENYGLLFVGGELLLFNQEIKFFDAENGNVAKKILKWHPDFIFFSPMTTFFPLAKKIAKEIKKENPEIFSVFGGHHVCSCPEINKMNEIDVLVIGPVRGSVDRVLSKEKGVIKIIPTTPDDLPMPARKEYYRDIPRMRGRYRKVMASMLGCPWNCSYCSSSSGHLKSIYGNKAHRNYFLKRRSISAIIEEAKDILNLGETAEIEWVDDDIFSGSEAWLSEFIDEWKNEINLPLYVSTTSKFVLKTSDEILSKLRGIVNCVGLGIQAIRPGSLKLFNRAWDNERQMKEAYDRCILFGYSVNLQAIIGLPVDDPVEDALETVRGLQRIGSGSICSVYPLQIYPGTEMEKYCSEKGFKMSPSSPGDTNTGIPGISFQSDTVKRIRNMCKLATFFVKYNIDERWMRIFLEIDFDENTSRMFSWQRYHECVLDRLGSKGEKVFEKIFKSTKLRY